MVTGRLRRMWKRLRNWDERAGGNRGSFDTDETVLPDSGLKEKPFEDKLNVTALAYSSVADTVNTGHSLLRGGEDQYVARAQDGDGAAAAAAFDATTMQEVPMLTPGRTLEAVKQEDRRTLPLASVMPDQGCHHIYSMPHRAASAPANVQNLMRMSHCCAQMPSAASYPASTTSLASAPLVGLSEASAVEYGVPGWERLLTAQIAACSGMSAANSRRTSAASYGGPSQAPATNPRPASAAQQPLATPTPTLSPPPAPTTSPFTTSTSPITISSSSSPPHPPSPPPAPLPSATPSTPALSVRVSSMGGHPRSSFRQVVLPKALVTRAAEHGTDLTIDMQRDVVVDFNRPLGSGQFGAVYAGTYRGAPVAIKRIRPLLQGCSIEDVEVFVQEVTVLSSLRHENVVRLLGGCLQPPDICLVEELCVTSLDAVLHHRGSGDRHSPAIMGTAAAEPPPPPPASLLLLGHASSSASLAAAEPPPTAQSRSPLPLFRVLEVALDVALGLEYLHGCSPAVVHRDLKPSNILLDQNGRAKISDFGLARCKYTAYLDTNRPETGSMAYMAPECWDPHLDGGLSDKMDIFSYGVVLWELVVGERPWASMKMNDFVLEVVSQGARLKVPTDDNICPYALRCLISACTEEWPSDRPSIKHVITELRRMLKYCHR